MVQGVADTGLSSFQAEASRLPTRSPEAGRGISADRELHPRPWLLSDSFLSTHDPGGVRAVCEDAEGWRGEDPLHAVSGSGYKGNAG